MELNDSASDSLDIQKKPTAICPMCGLPFELNTNGRPRVFCNDDCRKLDQLLGWVEDLVSGKQFTQKKKNKLRSRFWYLANCLNGKRVDLAEEVQG